jgi:hypothetical protein
MLNEMIRTGDSEMSNEMINKGGAYVNCVNSLLVKGNSESFIILSYLRKKSQSSKEFYYEKNK